MNIYQRINAVMNDVEYVQKDTEVSGGGNYKAVSHDMVVAVLRKSMVANGIVVRTVQLKGKYVQLRDQGAGLKMHLYRGVYQVDFVNIENPEEYCRTVVEGHANDTGDKAPGKALSYAVKYAMLKTFSLETGEDDEQRFSEPYSQDQLAVFHELLDGERHYEFYMFNASLPAEAQAGLYNSFPDGKKVQGKKAVKEAMTKGKELFDNTVGQVQELLAAQDPAVTEITAEMNPVEKRMLAGRLSDFELNQLKKFADVAA